VIFKFFLSKRDERMSIGLICFRKGNKRRDVLNILINFQWVNLAQIFNAYPANVENMVSS